MCNGFLQGRTNEFFHIQDGSGRTHAVVDIRNCEPSTWNMHWSMNSCMIYTCISYVYVYLIIYFNIYIYNVLYWNILNQLLLIFLGRIYCVLWNLMIQGPPKLDFDWMHWLWPWLLHYTQFLHAFLFLFGTASEIKSSCLRVARFQSHLI
jgi:hypothetical protein